MKYFESAKDRTDTQMKLLDLTCSVILFEILISTFFNYVSLKSGAQ